VGLRIIDLSYDLSDNRKETLTVAVWYPTRAEPRPFTYGEVTSFRSRLALNSAVAASGAPYPLVVFAHGAYGSGYNSAYFMEYLASHGYVTVAADYKDKAPPDYTQQVAFSRIRGGNTANPLIILALAREFVDQMNQAPGDFLRYLAAHRLPVTSFIVDRMVELNREAGSFLQGTIRENAIGMCGHSLGGATVLGKIGAPPDQKSKDDRIRAALVFSAPAYPFATTLARVHVPVMLMVGDDDSPALGPDLPRRTIYNRVNPPRYYLVLKDATHFAFGNRGCGRRPFYRAVNENAQANAICRYGLAFLDKHLRKDPFADAQLKRSDPAWAYYVREEEPGQPHEWGKEPPPGDGGPGGIRKKFRRRRLRMRSGASTVDGADHSL